MLFLVVDVEWNPVGSFTVGRIKDRNPTNKEVLDRFHYWVQDRGIKGQYFLMKPVAETLHGIVEGHEPTTFTMKI
jgi:hypothetical protein